MLILAFFLHSLAALLNPFSLTECPFHLFTAGSHARVRWGKVHREPGRSPYQVQPFPFNQCFYTRIEDVLQRKRFILFISHFMREGATTCSTFAASRRARMANATETPTATAIDSLYFYLFMCEFFLTPLRIPCWTSVYLSFAHPSYFIFADIFNIPHLLTRTKVIIYKFFFKLKRFCTQIQIQGM